ncbi:ECF transporter S component [Tissierella sp. MB52-C2]|uniref:ECF transporter S component n=1 Tax=Tissierella sp. MB52-C2 TaxID=3070999 RepID=UPI00280A84C7|nr:ECF transporter S component [Tissierella sp. MB52-C2]WMM23716.1 ECF transporter S component [Tissierella sp. MB52-C2]
MQEIYHTKKIVIGGTLLALGIIMVNTFHSTGIPGNIFLPMHIPIFLGGLLLPPYLALILGMVMPLCNTIISGMPSLFPMAIIMVFELGTYGLIASILYRKMKMPAVISLIISMICGRIIAGLAVFLLSIFFAVKLNPVTFVIGGITTGIPGIIIQLVLIPSLIYAIKRYTTIDLDE